MHAEYFEFLEFKSVIIDPLWILLIHCWIWRLIAIKLFEWKHLQKSSTYNELLTPTGKHLMVLFIFNINKVTDEMTPYDIPISWSYKSDKHEPTGTRKDLTF